MRVALPLAVSAADFGAIDRGAEVRRLDGETMGTTWSLNFTAPSALSVATIDRTVRDTLDWLIRQFSHWERDSDISRFNRSAIGSWMRLPPDLATALDAGLCMAALTGGAFDPAVGRLVDMAGFGPSGLDCFTDDPQAIGAALAEGGWRAVERDLGFARRTADITLDLSGIGKGHAVDAVTERLAGIGLRHFLFEIGGEFVGRGLQPDGQPWWVDVETPPGLAARPLRVGLHGLAIATSGDYRRWHATGGHRIHHTIDPRTGRPLDNAVASVSVLHASCMLADAWATAITVLGPQDGPTFATDHAIAMRMVVRAGPSGFEERLSPALATMLD